MYIVSLCVSKHVYFRYSFIRDSGKRGGELIKLLLLSNNAVHMLNTNPGFYKFSSTARAILPPFPLFFLFNYNMALLTSYFSLIIFVRSKRVTKVGLYHLS